MTLMCFVMKPTITDNDLTNSPPDVMVYLTTGISCSPSVTVRSTNSFLALSSPACTVLFCLSNSSSTLLPSA